MATIGYVVPKGKRHRGGARRHLELEGELNFGDALKIMNIEYGKDIKAGFAKQAAAEKEKSDSKVAGWFRDQNRVPYNNGTVVTRVPLVGVPVSRNSGDLVELGQFFGLKPLKKAQSPTIQSPKKRKDEKPGSGETPYKRSESGRRGWQDQNDNVRLGGPFVHQQQHRPSVHHNKLFLPGVDDSGVREFYETAKRLQENRDGKPYSTQEWKKFFEAREAVARHGDGKKVKSGIYMKKHTKGSTPSKIAARKERESGVLAVQV
eukprot:269289-Rhodomonas_salina.1